MPDPATGPPVRPDPPEAPAASRGTVSGRAAWRRLRLMGSPRATRANLVVGLLAVSLGFAIAAQVRQTNLEGLANLREDELVRILDNVTQENSRLSDEIRDLAVRAFRALDCQGLSRVDFFITENGPVINEINTMPGFTSISMYPRMWEAAGVDNRELVSTLIRTALARGTGLR